MNDYLKNNNAKIEDSRGTRCFEIVHHALVKSNQPIKS